MLYCEVLMWSVLLKHELDKVRQVATLVLQNLIYYHVYY